MNFAGDSDKAGDEVVYANSGGEGLLPEVCEMRRVVMILFSRDGRKDRSDRQIDIGSINRPLKRWTIWIPASKSYVPTPNV